MGRIPAPPPPRRLEVTTFRDTRKRYIKVYGAQAETHTSNWYGPGPRKLSEADETAEETHRLIHRDCAYLGVSCPTCEGR